MNLLQTAIVSSLVLGCGWRHAPAAESRDLILVAGQSNAVGFDASPADLPTDPADREILFWWRCGDPPPDAHDSVGRGWGTLQAQPLGDPAPKKGGMARQYGNFSHAEGGFGPEIGFARTLHSRGKSQLAVVKAAFSGTGLRTDWNHEDAGAGGACYRALIEETKTAIEAAAGRGIKLKVRALVWVQGESDANAKDAPEYEKRLGALITALRQELKAPQMVALVGVNTNFGNGKNAFMPEIIKQQESLASHLPRCLYVDTRGLTYANAAHFDSASTLEVGRRFAAALLKFEGAAAAEEGGPPLKAR